MPKVSVIIPSYKHERFVRECVQSVLDQTFQDFEIIITDDGSPDHTVDVIRGFKDKRIKLFVHTENRGACVAANNCIKHSRGQYIAMLSSDDVWLPQKLECQVDYLERHTAVAAVFSRVHWIDADSRPITDLGFPNLRLFDVENRSRYEWLHHFFYKGNCLCHPSSLVRKDCYDAVGWLNPSFANLPDFDLWIRLCLKYDIHVLDEQLIRFRKISEDTNASGNNMFTQRRLRFEHMQILNHYLELDDTRALLQVFPDARRYGPARRDLIPYFVARTALDYGGDFIVLWGLETLYRLLQDAKTARRLEKLYGFTHRDLIEMTGQGRIFIDLAPYEVKASPPYHLGWNIRRARALLFPTGSRRERAGRWIKRTLQAGLQAVLLLFRGGRQKAPLA